MEEVLRLFLHLQYWVHTPRVDYHISLINLIFVGLMVGVMTGFWGMGGRFLMIPLLNIFFNIPYNVAVGSDICQMLGTSSMNLVRSKIMETVDYKLACWMLLGAVSGVECGARLLEVLDRAPDLVIMGLSLRILFWVMSVIYGFLLFWIGTILYRESKVGYGRAKEPAGLTDLQLDVTARLQTVHLPPLISLPASGILGVSLWVVLGVGFLSGLLVGFLGVGGSFLVLPALIYILGCPMGVARSTDLLGNFFMMGYGTFSHSLKGNIDLILVIFLFLSSTLGKQIGTFSAKRFSASRVQRGFALAAFAVVLSLTLKFFRTLGLISFPF
jgi:uncharacterized membrane protein YfcA